MRKLKSIKSKQKPNKSKIMKKSVLILVGIMAIISTVSAKNEDLNTNSFNNNFYYNDVINFYERGIEFFVFTNGEFDFDTSNSYVRGVRIKRDYNGMIRSVGNVFINYDHFGNVTRIGNIFMQYHSGRLTRVGDLRISYDRWGAPIYRGNVQDYYVDNGVRFSVNFGRIYNYNDAFFNHGDFNRNYTRFREDRDFYYYKANPNSRIRKDDSILKRRKPASANNRDQSNSNNSENRYRKSDSKREDINENSIRWDVKENKKHESHSRNSDNKYRKSDSKRENINENSKREKNNRNRREN